LFIVEDAPHVKDALSILSCPLVLLVTLPCMKGAAMGASSSTMENVEALTNTPVADVLA
jgi:hypothetical protein